MALIVKNAHLWDGVSGGEPKPGMSVVCENGRFTRIAPDAEVMPNEIDTIIDAAGRFVMPGMIDCHVHITSPGDPDSSKDAAEADSYLALRAAKMAELDMQAGFTTVRNMGSRNYIDLALQKAQKSGFASGARVITCGPCLTMTGGHGWMGGTEVDGCDEARKAARQNLKRGVDLIKIMATGGVMTPGVEPGSAQLTEAEIRAAVEEAHKAGRKTATHAQGSEGIKNAIRAGIDSIEHGFYLDDEILEMMLNQGVSLVPTLVAPYHIVEGGLSAGIPEYAVDKASRCAEDHLESFRRALAKGIRIGMGTDAGTPLNRHGENALELRMFVDNGMSNEQAMLCATRIAADVCDRSDSIGTIETGKIADMLIIDGNPLEDISILVAKTPIKIVIMDGKVAFTRC